MRSVYELERIGVKEHRPSESLHVALKSMGVRVGVAESKLLPDEYIKFSDLLVLLEEAYEEYPGCDESPEATAKGAWYKCSRCGARQILHELLREDSSENIEHCESTE